jgi:hypothetical protein
MHLRDNRVSDDPIDPEAAEETAAEKKARLKRAAELLGDIMPTTTRDETSEGWNEKSGTSREEEFLRDVPPHHG